MTKTTKMLLIEERAGKDIREVMSAAYDATQSIQRAGEQIETLYGVSVSFGVFSDWVEGFGGSYGKKLQFPSEALEETREEAPAEPIAA